jgi:hypothetical protein
VKEQLIILYDSFYQGVSPYAKTQMDILQHFIIDNTKNQNWNVTYNSKCQFQKNGCDCGVFMITFSLFFLSDFFAESVEGIDFTELARCKIAMDITRGFIKDPRIINNDLLLIEPDEQTNNTNNSTSCFEYSNYVVDVIDDNNDPVQKPPVKDDEKSLQQKKKELKFKKAKLTIKTQINELNIVKKQLRKLSIENKKLRKMKFPKSNDVGSDGTTFIFK